MLVRVEVKNIGLDSQSGSPILMLVNAENNDEIYPIWIGITEAEGILLHKSGVETPRPLTYDLLKNIIEAMGGSIDKVEIYDKRENIYIARIIVDQNGNKIEIDARPSDAVNIAIRFDAPIFVEEEIMQKISMKQVIQATPTQQQETEGYQQDYKQENREDSEALSDRELEEFKRMLDNIKPEDFALDEGKGKGEG